MMNDRTVNKSILIGEHDPQQRAALQSMLAGEGYGRVLVGRNGVELMGCLRACRGTIGDVGLILVNLDLPDCRIQSLCLMASSAAAEGVEIPVFVYCLEPCQPGSARAEFLAGLRREGVIAVSMAPNANLFMPLVELALQLAGERHLRRTQGSLLTDELAERKIMETRLKYLLLHDELTGLGNRRRLEEEIENALREPADEGRESALLYLDLDRFNIINDLEGHGSGDHLLVEVVGLLSKNLRGNYLATRIGADEFCIFMTDTGPRQAAIVAERLRRAFDGYCFATGSGDYRISVSIGVATLSPSRERPGHAKELIAQAHQACCVSKSHGRNRVHVHSDKDNDTSTRHSDVMWVSKLRDALAENWFFLEFQPVVRLRDGAISHYEVLIRMRDNKGVVHGPGEFIPAAERMGLICQVDLWVLQNALDFLVALPSEQADVCLNLNLSGYTFGVRSLPGLIRKKLEETGILPSRITFELTETANVSSYHKTREMIQRIRALGCRFALDDFGAGFSSFDYIKKFPVDYLKIDGQFIRNLLHDETDQVLVKAMIDIARKLGKQTVAEFVENARILAVLQKLGVDYVQGYLLGAPTTSLLPERSVSLFQLLQKPSVSSLSH